MTNQNDFILEHYAKYLTETGKCRSEKSKKDYLLSLTMFEREAGPCYLETVTDYRRFHWLVESLASRTAWPDGRPKKRWSGRMIYKVACECVVFFRWAFAFQFTPHNIALDNPECGHLFEKGPGKEPEFFDWKDPDLLKLLYDPSNSLRKRALYEICRASGIRPSECAGLTRDDIRLEDKIIFLKKRKGGKSGFAPLDEDAILVLREYFRGLDLHYSGEWAFPKENYAGPITPHGLWKMMHNHGKKLGIHFYPYRLRHSVPAELAARGHDALTIAEVMGHGDPRTTRIYFHLTKERMKRIYARPTQIASAQ